MLTIVLITVTVQTTSAPGYKDIRLSAMKAAAYISPRFWTQQGPIATKQHRFCRTCVTDSWAAEALAMGCLSLTGVAARAAGGDTYGGAILDAAEDQIFTDNSSILATFANITALAVSVHSQTHAFPSKC